MLATLTLWAALVSERAVFQPKAGIEPTVSLFVSDACICADDTLIVMAVVRTNDREDFRLESVLKLPTSDLQTDPRVRWMDARLPSILPWLWTSPMVQNKEVASLSLRIDPTSGKKIDVLPMEPNHGSIIKMNDHEVAYFERRVRPTLLADGVVVLRAELWIDERLVSRSNAVHVRVSNDGQKREPKGGQEP